MYYIEFTLLSFKSWEAEHNRFLYRPKINWNIIKPPFHDINDAHQFHLAPLFPTDFRLYNVSMQFIQSVQHFRLDNKKRKKCLEHIQWNSLFCGTFAFRGDEEAWGGVSGIWDSSIQARVRAGFSTTRASLQEFTSAAIRRDSQYACYGHANTVLCKGRGCNSEEEGG